MEDNTGIFSHPLRQGEAKVVAGIAVFYLLLWFLLPASSFWGVDNSAKFQGARSFAETGRMLIAYDGADFDPNGDFRHLVLPLGEMHKGKQVPAFPVLFMFLGGLFYWLFGFAGASILSVLGGFATLAAAWLMWIRHRERRDARMFLIVLCIGSPLLFYSLTMWEYSWSMAFVTASIALVSRGRKAHLLTRAYEPLMAGVMLVLATAMRTEAGLIAGIIILLWGYTAHGLGSLKYFLIGLGGGIVLIGMLNFWQTGLILPIHISTNAQVNHASSFFSLLFTRAHNIYVILIEGFDANIWSLVGVSPLLAAVLWKKWRRKYGIWILLATGIAIAWITYISFAFSADNRTVYTSYSGGLLWVMPLSALAIKFFRGERRRFWRLVWMTFMIYILFLLVFLPSVEGVHWGPRFVLPVVPLIIIFAFARVQRWWKSFPVTRPLLVMLISISILSQFYSYFILRETRVESAALNKWAVAKYDEPSLSSMRWLPALCAMQSDRTPWYLTERSDRIQKVVHALRKRGVRFFRFYENPPYIDKKFWWEVGAEPDPDPEYFLEGGGTLRRLRMRIID